jgi:hypothetical protein
VIRKEKISSSRNQIEEMTNIWDQKGKNINIWKPDRRKRMTIAWS